MSARARWWIVAVAALVGAGVTARLGAWQLDRAAQKTALQAALDARSREAPLDTTSAWTADRDAAAALHYRRARLQGHWSAAHTVFLDNRPMDGRAGFYVVTPLVLADGRAVLVQRGWVPRDALDRTRLPQVGTPEGLVAVSGRMAPPPGRLYEFQPDERGRIRQNLDVDAFARETGLRLAPLSVVQTEPEGPADTLRRDWPSPDTGVAKHRGYAFQWFALSSLIVLLYVWFQLIQPRRRGRR
ncbi:MAG TPA: SURF1 family protein [Burkholderiaceae bacterium]|nr:SURF1 family protein [Burkholderiaceae bacterium]